MKLTDILEPKCVKAPLESNDKPSVIKELVNLLDQAGHLTDAEDVLQAVMDREAVRSTGIGQGFAVPHGKSPNVDKLIMAIGKLAEPIDFDSIDNEPVTIVILLLSPIDRTGPHIQALARISRLMTDSSLRNKIWTVESAEKMFQYIVEHEKDHPDT